MQLSLLCSMRYKLLLGVVKLNENIALRLIYQTRGVIFVQAEIGIMMIEL
jgi:hypothetical protein